MIWDMIVNAIPLVCCFLLSTLGFLVVYCLILGSADFRRY